VSSGLTAGLMITMGSASATTFNECWCIDMWAAHMLLKLSKGCLFVVHCVGMPATVGLCCVQCSVDSGVDPCMPRLGSARRLQCKQAVGSSCVLV
jgi:hypothetical protein